MRGWVPPEDRLWRHPSEISSVPPAGAVPPTGAAPHAGAPPGPGAPVGAWPPPASPEARSPERRRTWGMVVAGVGAAAAVMVALVLLVSVGGNGRPAPRTVVPAVTSSSLAAGAGGLGSGPPVAAALQQSMVALKTRGPRGDQQACAVAVAEGGLVATTAQSVAGARTITATTTDGRVAGATVVAVDRRSDVALLRVGDSLPVPRFEPATAVAAGTHAVVMTLAWRDDRPETDWAVDRVEAVGATVVGGPASGLAGIAATVPGVPPVGGDLLVDSRTGAVAGLLDTDSGAAGVAGMFLPADLVVGVSGDLAAFGHVSHGWLDMEGDDSPGTARSGPAGAVVVRVEAPGASVSALRPGDIIVAVGAQPVRSMAQLRVSLYLLAPGTPIELTVDRGGTRTAVAVSLSASP